MGTPISDAQRLKAARERFDTTRREYAAALAHANALRVEYGVAAYELSRLAYSVLGPRRATASEPTG